MEPVSLFDRGVIGNCTQDQLAAKAREYLPGDTFKCNEGRATWECSVHVDGYNCLATISEYKPNFFPPASGLFSESTIA
jgi:hypothetical protein